MGVELGKFVGIIDGGAAATSTHVPHDADNPLDTHVPTPVWYLPVKPVIVTREPVTAFTPPPDTHVGVVVANGNQLPGVP